MVNAKPPHVLPEAVARLPVGLPVVAALLSVQLAEATYQPGLTGTLTVVAVSVALSVYVGELTIPDVPVAVLLSVGLPTPLVPVYEKGQGPGLVTVPLIA